MEQRAVEEEDVALIDGDGDTCRVYARRARRGGRLRKISHLSGRHEVPGGPAVRARRDHRGAGPCVGVL